MSGKVALVTGAVEGIDFETAKRLREQVACLALVDINEAAVGKITHPAFEEVIRRQGHIIVFSSVAAFCPSMFGAVELNLSWTGY